MSRWQTDQDRAHWLLVRWAANQEAALGSEYPPAPTEPSIQGDVAELTRPETHAQDQREHQAIDRAVNRLATVHPLLKAVLWQAYIAGPWLASGQPDERRMAEEMGWTIKHWREWRDAARKALIDDFDARG